MCELAKQGRFLVHGLSRDPSTAHRKIRSSRLYGVVSVSRSSLARLPYADDLVNLVVVDKLADVLAFGCTVDEMVRVLAPGGTAYVGQRGSPASTMALADRLKSLPPSMGVSQPRFIQDGGLSLTFTKARPAGMDEWTHVRHGPDGNAVSEDTLIAPMSGLRWLYGPIWRHPGGRCLTADGRNFYEMRETLVARDAFNGLPLWQRPWNRLSSLTALGDRVYASVSAGSPIAALDAGTGQVRFEFRAIKHAGREALVHVGPHILFANGEAVGSVKRDTGEVNWMRPDVRGGTVLIAVGDRVFVRIPRSKTSEDPMRIVCLGLASGEDVWRRSEPHVRGELVFCKYGVLVCQHTAEVEGEKGRRMFTTAYSAVDGSRLWSTGPNPIKGQEVYGIQNLIWWVPRYRNVRAFDPLTGAVEREWTVQGGHYSYQCSRNGAATTEYLIGGRPTVYLDMQTGKSHWMRVARNACQGDPGILLGNGLTYAFPKACKCFSMLRGYSAFGVDRQVAVDPEANRLERGPAFGKVSRGGPGAPGPWPTYRGDARRSASTTDRVALPLEVLWRAKPEDQVPLDWLAGEWDEHITRTGAVSAPVVADGLVGVALPDSHSVAALDADTGRLRWRYTAGGRVLLPPTFHAGLALFGCQDGWVYCLRAADGALVWRFRAAPRESLALAFGQLESRWPVTGGVLVKSGRAYFAAGRTSELAGGVVGYAVDAWTGKLLWQAEPPPTERDRGTVRGIAYLGDLPVDAGTQIQLAHPRWLVHAETGQSAGTAKALALHSSRDGLLDYSWPRKGPTSRGPVYQRYGSVTGDYLVFQESKVFGYCRRPPSARAKSRANTIFVVDTKGDHGWTVDVPTGVLIEAMALAGDVLFVAGTRTTESTGERGMILALSAEDGRELATVQMDDLPATAGLAVGDGRLYLSTRQGQVLCMGRK